MCFLAACSCEYERFLCRFWRLLFRAWLRKDYSDAAGRRLPLTEATRPYVLLAELTRVCMPLVLCAVDILEWWLIIGLGSPYLPVFGALSGRFDAAMAARGGFALSFCYIIIIGDLLPLMLGSNVQPSTSLRALTLLWPSNFLSFI